MSDFAAVKHLPQHHTTLTDTCPLAHPLLQADMSDFAAVNAIYGRFFPSNPPARATFAVKGCVRICLLAAACELLPASCRLLAAACQLRPVAPVLHALPHVCPLPCCPVHPNHHVSPLSLATPCLTLEANCLFVRQNALQAAAGCQG